MTQRPEALLETVNAGKVLYSESVRYPCLTKEGLMKVMQEIGLQVDDIFTEDVIDEAYVLIHGKVRATELSRRSNVFQIDSHHYLYGQDRQVIGNKAREEYWTAVQMLRERGSFKKGDVGVRAVFRAYAEVIDHKARP